MPGPTIIVGPGIAGAYDDRGFTYRTLGDNQHAIADFNQALEIDPGFAKAYFDRGVTLNMVGQTKEALRDYTKAIECDADYSLAYYNRANLWLDQGKNEKAITDFDQAIRTDPSFAWSYTGRGRAWANQGVYDKAVADLDKGIRRDPNQASAYTGRGWIWEKKDEYAKALDDYNAALRVGSIAWILATCPDDEYRNGKRAVELAALACELSNWQSDQLITTLAASHAEVGDFEMALKFHQQAIELGNESDLLSKMLESFQDGKAYRDAASAVGSDC